MFQIVIPRAGPDLTPGGIKWTNLVKSTRRCYVQNIKALGLPLSEKKNSKICLLCSYAPTCEPHGRTSPDPRRIIWTNLVEVHKEMLHTKYKCSRPSSFIVEEIFILCSYVQLMTPRVGLVLTPGAFYDKNLVEVYKEMPHTKYQISMTSSFREENFCSYVQTCDPLRRGQFWPQGHHMNKFGRGPQGDAIYQISKLKAFQFQGRRIFKFSLFIPMFQLVNPEAGRVLTPGASYEQTWYSSTIGPLGVATYQISKLCTF